MFFGDTRRLGLIQREGYRHKFARVGNLATDQGVRGVVAYIYGIRQNNFWSKIARQLDREEFTRRLLATDRTERALLDLAMSIYAGSKPIRGEKTPAHIYAVPTLLEWFPQARIIHTFRDPRAVYISNKRKYEKRELSQLSVLARRTKLMFEFYSSLDVMLDWFRVIRLHHEYERRYAGRYYLSKYEDLILDPRGTLHRLCDFLGIDFVEEMMQQTMPNSSFAPRNQVSGFDTSAIDRWRQYLHPVINEWFVIWCNRRLSEFGYRP